MNESEAETLERLLHTRDHAAQVHAHLLRVMRLREDFADGPRHVAKVLPRRGHVDVDDALNLVVIDFSRD